MAEGDTLSIGTIQPMPKIFGVNGEEMAPSDIKENDILVVFWVEPTKYKAETSVVRFEKFGEGTRFDARRVVFLSRAEFELPDICSYPLNDIREIRFCAKSSSASSQIFDKLHEFYKENRKLAEKLRTVRKRFMDFVA